MSQMPLILDPCCGSRMMWFDRNHPDVAFGDRRNETITVTDRTHRQDGTRTLAIEPDAIMDFRELPYPDETFYLVAFDPPHLVRAGRGAQRTSSGRRAASRRSLPWSDGLCIGGKMNVPNRKEGESELEHLRRKEIAFGIWQGDALERMRDLEADLAQAEADRDKYRLALNQLHEALFIAQRYAMLQGHEMSGDEFARDFAPFRNVMAHHGIEPYAKPKRARKVGADGTVHNAKLRDAEPASSAERPSQAPGSAAG